MSFDSKSDLDIHQLLLFESEYKNRSKPFAVAFLLFFIGFFGLHRFYLGHIATGILQVVLYLILVIAFAFDAYIIAIITFLFLFGWFLYDLFTLKGKVDKFNQEVEEKLLQEIIIYTKNKNK